MIILGKILAVQPRPLTAPPSLSCLPLCLQWERSKWVGVSMVGKTLAIMGFGKVGSEVARRAKGLGMTVLAYDPYASAEKAAALGATIVSFDEALARVRLASSCLGGRCPAVWVGAALGATIVSNDEALRWVHGVVSLRRCSGWAAGGCPWLCGCRWRCAMFPHHHP